jgi:hypothetical protein
MATTGFFSNGILSLLADANGNGLTVSRNAAGTIFVNAGSVAISGGMPKVANTSLIQVFGLGGNDFITLDETNGGLPRTSVLGRTDDDATTCPGVPFGPADDRLFAAGEAGRVGGKATTT